MGNIINFIKSSLVRIFYINKIDYNTWVFSSTFNSKFNYNSKYLFEYVLKNYKDIKPIYVINDDELRRKLSEKYGKKYFIETKSFEGIKKVLSCGVWFTSAGLPIYGFNLNKKRIILNLWHGIPLKKIALMENNLSKLTRMYFKYIFSKNYTYIFTTSKKLVDIMAKSFEVSNDKVKVIGQPRNDVIFRANHRESILNNLYKDLPTYKKIILYAPTFRDNGSTILFPFEDYNVETLEEFLEQNELVIFIRLHQSEKANSEYKNNKRIKFINQDKVEDINEILNIFDMLITDYSSIYIDYLLTEKPILFLPYDKEDYLRERGLNFEYDGVTPGSKPKTFYEFKEDIIKSLNSDFYLSERKEVNKIFNEIQNECSKDICNFLLKEIEVRRELK